MPNGCDHHFNLLKHPYLAVHPNFAVRGVENTTENGVYIFHRLLHNCRDKHRTHNQLSLPIMPAAHAFDNHEADTIYGGGPTQRENEREEQLILHTSLLLSQLIHLPVLPRAPPRSRFQVSFNIKFHLSFTFVYI